MTELRYPSNGKFFKFQMGIVGITFSSDRAFISNYEFTRQEMRDFITVLSYYDMVVPEND